MTLAKADIVETLAKNGFTKKKSIDMVESLLEIIKSNLERSENLLVSGFGKFYVREKAQRVGRNPKTGEEAIVSDRKVVRFKCSPVMRKKMNSK